MMHEITLIDEQRHIDVPALNDFIELFFTGRGSKFDITIFPTWHSNDREGLRGQHRILNNTHVIQVFSKAIQRCVERKEPVGGNNTIAKSISHGVHLVLAHELRHGYQHLFHGTTTNILFKGRYSGRAGEIDARRHVDECYDAITDFVSDVL